jgi:hypothetical protein
MKVACIETHATLCIYSDDEPQLERLVQSLTKLEATKVVENERKVVAGFQIPKYGWFFASKEQISSLEASDHIRWILEKIADPKALSTLRQRGCKTKMMCYWVSSGEGGGPVLDEGLIMLLAQHSIDVEFDIYFEEAPAGSSPH